MVSVLTLLQLFSRAACAITNHVQGAMWACNKIVTSLYVRLIEEVDYIAKYGV